MMVPTYLANLRYNTHTKDEAKLKQQRDTETKKEVTTLTLSIFATPSIAKRKEQTSSDKASEP